MSELSPAKDLEQVLDLFEPTTVVDAQSAFYIERNEDGLKKLARKLRRKKQFHGFLCGHVGSGKTTELMRLKAEEAEKGHYFPILIRAGAMQIDSVNLTHDALLMSIGLELLNQTSEKELSRDYEEQLRNWGRDVIKTFVKDESINAEAGAKGNAWWVYFKAMLKSRNQWKYEEKMRLVPKVLDLIALLDTMAQDLKNTTGKMLLVMIDDLEKGTSDAEKQMHHRLFSEYYDVLTAPNFTIVYTLPVYYKGLVATRIPKDCIFSFSAVRIYEPEDKVKDVPPLNKDGEGYQLIEEFINCRIDPQAKLFEEGVLDELIRIGGGLFRDTDAIIADAADIALERGAQTISMDDAKKVFNNLKKDYQPAIRGDAIKIMGQIMLSEHGWPENVEPLLQSRAVVEYENGDIWLDVRYVLKAYLKSLLEAEKDKPALITSLT